MKLPKNFGKNKKGGESKISPLKNWTVHSITIDSFIRTLDDGMIFDPKNVGFGETISANDKSFDMHVWGTDYTFIPVISLDNYNVILIENILENHAVKLVNKPKNHAYPCVDDLKYDSHWEIIHAFGLDQVKLLNLTIKGLKMYENICLIQERYDLLIKYRNFINEWCDGDLKNIK